MAEPAATDATTETVDAEVETQQTGTETSTTETVKDWETEAKKWQSQARENEKRAKANATAAKQLQEIEDANKTETQKLADALDDARAQTATATTELARLRAAVKHGLAEDDLDLLGTGTPDEIEARAERLAKRFADGVKADATRPVSSLGSTTNESNGATQLERDLRQALNI